MPSLSVHKSCGVVLSMQYIPPPSDDQIHRSDSPGETLRKQIHQLTRQALESSGRVKPSSEQLMQALTHVLRLLHQQRSDLSEPEQHQLLLSLLAGIREKTHKVRVRFIDNN